MFNRLAAAARWMLFAVAIVLSSADPSAARAQSSPAPAEPGLFDQLFGSDPASERPGQASDGLALPGLFADGRQIADTLPVYDLGPGADLCVTLIPLLDALELAHEEAGSGDVAVILPEPQRRIVIPQAAQRDSPDGRCLPLRAIADHLPLSLENDRVSQRLILTSLAPLPVLMRLARTERQARLRPEVAGPDYPLQVAPDQFARLWSADVSAGVTVTNGGADPSAALLVSGALAGMSARGSLSISGAGGISAGFTLSAAGETPELLGPLGARSFALGDVSGPQQPLIGDSLVGRGLVVSSRAPWRADLVDSIDLSGPLPTGWEAELWHDDRLVAVVREADAAGLWRFSNIPVRLGENRWIVRLYGPHGESSERLFTRLVGTEMNAENEVDYGFGVVDAGRPLLGESSSGTGTGPAVYGTLGWGLTPGLTSRLDMRAGLDGTVRLAVGVHGAFAGLVWATTLARDGAGSLGGSIRVARRFGAQDLLIDIARHGNEISPDLPPLVRQFSDFTAIQGQGRIGVGRLSVPWQMRFQSGTLRGGRSQQILAARLSLPMAEWQASAAVGLTREEDQPWQGNAALGLSARAGNWRLRGGMDATVGQRLRVGSARFHASRTVARGTVGVDVDWQMDRGRFGAGLSLNQQLGVFGLAASVAHGQDGFRAGVSLVVGLWRGPRQWQAAPAGLTRGGAILADIFVDENGDGVRGAEDVPVDGARFMVGSAIRQETSDALGHVLIRGLPTGRPVDVELQLASIEDFTLRPARAGDRVALRPGEIRHLAVPLRPTGSVEARVLLQTGDSWTARPGVRVILRDGAGTAVAEAVSDFDGYVLFEQLAFGSWRVEALGQRSAELNLTRASPEQRTRLLLPAA